MESICAICLDRLKYPLGRPDNCEHGFCFRCISDWFKKRSQCPLCFGAPPKYLIKTEKNKHETKVPVRKRTARQFENELLIREQQEDHSGLMEEDITIAYASCRICQRSDNEHLLLLCDGYVGENADGSMIRCNVAYHTYCLPEKLEKIPNDDWFCPFCANKPENIRHCAKQTDSNIPPSEVPGTSHSTLHKNESYASQELKCYLNRESKECGVKIENIECSNITDSGPTIAHGACGDSDVESESIASNCSDENSNLYSETAASTTDNYDDHDDDDVTIGSSDEVTIDDSEEENTDDYSLDYDDQVDDEESDETSSDHEQSNRPMYHDDYKRRNMNRCRGKATHVADKVAGFIAERKSKSGKTMMKYQGFMLKHHHTV